MANTIGWGQAAVNNTIDWGKGKTNNTIGWGTIYSSSPYGDTDLIGTPATDADADAFITAAAITDTTQKRAIDKLVVDLKGYGIWTKMKAIYPFVGGTAAQHKYNLVNPSLYQLTYSTGLTHSSLGIKGSGLSYANTNYKNTILGVGQNDISVGVYLQSWNINQTMQFGNFGNFTLYKSGINNISPLINNAFVLSIPTASSNGFMQSSRNNSANLLFKHKNNTVATFAVASSALSSLDVWICRANAYDGTNDYISFFYEGNNLNSVELDNMYTAVQTFETTLVRQIV
jgi:hypothetical protein